MAACLHRTLLCYKSYVLLSLFYVKCSTPTVFVHEYQIKMTSFRFQLWLSTLISVDLGG